MLSLAQLQHQFSQALCHQQSAVSSHIRSDHFSAEQRLQVYRNNFIISLSEVLQAGYPMLLQLVGEECFNQLARRHVLSYPLKCADVSQYGEHFSDSVAQCESVISAVPYAADVARFEWCLDLARQRQSQLSANSSGSPIAELAQVPAARQSEIQLLLDLSLFAFRSDYALFALHQAFINQNFQKLNLYQPQCGVIGCDDNGQPWSLALTTVQYQLLTAIGEGHPLGQIEAALLGELPALLRLQLLTGYRLLNEENQS